MQREKGNNARGLRGYARARERLAGTTRGDSTGAKR
jgi:hypothetical protein